MAANIDLLDTTHATPRRVTSRARAVAQRGMTTAEYCVGILAAITFALVLVRVFSDNSVFQFLMRLVLKLLQYAIGAVH